METSLGHHNIKQLHHVKEYKIHPQASLGTRSFHVDHRCVFSLILMDLGKIPWNMLFFSLIFLVKNQWIKIEPVLYLQGFRFAPENSQFFGS